MYSTDILIGQQNFVQFLNQKVLNFILGRHVMDTPGEMSADLLSILKDRHRWSNNRLEKGQYL